LLAHQRKALIVGQPMMTATTSHDRQASKHNALAAMIAQRYGRRANVRFVDLRDAVDLRDPHVAPDGMHLTAEGNATIAARLVGPVLAVIGHTPTAITSAIP